jgi:excisionase family DNA binding protein
VSADADERAVVGAVPDPDRFVRLVAYGICGGVLHALQIGLAGETPAASTQRQELAEVMTADEVAEMLRLDRKTVYDYAGRGEIPCRRIGKRILFSREALALWLAPCSKGSSEGNSK